MSAIVVQGVRKKFRLHYDKVRSLKELFLFRKRDHHEDHWVLNGIDFTAEKGEAVGLIGHNGCGKSTLLKLMTRIMYPDEGKIEMTGRVSSLIELGAGFHPDMTGRENIYINAAIFGLTKKEIDARLEDIIAFSELGDFIDSPVRTYSSGMYMRLAFAVAINVDAEILLVDEILAVGDANFQKKCFDRIVNLKSEGVTIVIVSHDMASIERICDKVVWINDGVIVKQGTPKPAIMAYLEFMGRRQAEMEAALRHEAPSSPVQQAPVDLQRVGSQDVEITEARMLDPEGKECGSFPVSGPAELVLSYRINRPVATLGFGVSFFAQDGRNCYRTDTFVDGVPVQVGGQNAEGTIRLLLPSLCLVEGTYWVDVSAVSQDGYPYDYQEHRISFCTTSPVRDSGICRLPHEWRTEA